MLVELLPLVVINNFESQPKESGNTCLGKNNSGKIVVYKKLLLSLSYIFYIEGLYNIFNKDIMSKTLLQKTIVFCLFAFSSLSVAAQAPEGYYNRASNKKERELKTALSSIISPHNQRTYKQLWKDFIQTDSREDHSVWDMYSSLKKYTFVKEQCGTYKNEGDCYNREHSFPKSWFHDQYPMYTDLFHLYPTDGKVNGVRGNDPFGETATPSYASADSLSKLGPCSFPGYTGTVFEPADEYKGDFARSYLYMATCYEDSISGWESPMLANNSYPAFDEWSVNLLLKWCRQDPVSSKEKNRNESVYKIQNNRNPFIDFPGLEEYIWGNKTAYEFVPSDYMPNSSIDTLSILSFNDFHGAFVNDRNVPGAGELVQAVLTEKGKNKTSLVVSVGDNFSGSYFSRITRGNPLPEMWQKMDVKMSAVGNHEFDWGQPYLTDTAAVYMDFIGANIKAENGTSLKWLKPYQIVNQKLKDGSIARIAFVGLTTTDTSKKTTEENVKGILFTNPVDAARVEIATNLKKEGKVDMVVLLIHIGTNMDNKDIIEEDNAKQLPWVEGVDAIISGHSHKVVLAKVNNIPIIQAGVNGTHIGKLNFQIQRNDSLSKITFLSGDTIRVQGEKEPTIDSLVNKIRESYKFDEVLTTTEDDLIHDRNSNKFEYTSVGAYVTAAYVNSFVKNKNLPPMYKNRITLGVNHYGGLRTSILKGQVTKLQAGNVLPFGGNLVAYELTGDSIVKLLNEGRNNTNGFLQTSNLKLKLDKTGRIKSVISMPTGKKLNGSTKYIVVLDSFITTGGDGYSKSLFEDCEIKEFNDQHKETTEVFIDYLREAKSLSSKKAPRPVVE